MRQYAALNWLAGIIIGFALIAAGFGLFTPNTGNQITFTTVRHETVQVWGQGLYEYDTPMGAIGFMAADLITLVFAVPLLIISILLYCRSSLRGGLLLSGVLGYFLYNYISMGFGAAYNNFFLAYVIIFAASLYALILALLSFDIKALPAHFASSLPRKGIGVFLIVSGVILSLIWLVISIIPALIANRAATEASYYTTFTTAIMDIGIVAPALILAGLLIRRDEPSGYLLASTILIFTCVLGANLTAGGVIQVLKGVITIGQALVFTVPFVILTMFAIYFTVILFGNFSESSNPQKGHARGFAATIKY